MVMTSAITAVPFLVEAETLTAHGIIRIEGDVDLASQALAEGWAGSGTVEDPFTIENLSINAGGERTGIYIGGTTAQLIIRGCQVTGTSIYGGNGYGAIGLVNARNVQVVDNDCSNNPVYGINAYRSSNILITDNTVNGNKYGITLTECSASTVARNSIAQTSSGYSCIDCKGSGLPGDDVVIADNICTGVTGISLYQCPGYVITGNTITSAGSGGSGVTASRSDGCSITRNSVTGFSDGIALWDSSSSTVGNNTVSSHSNCGIRVDLSALATTFGNRIENNTITGGSYGISIYDSTSARVVDNICRSFIYTAIYLASYSSDGLVSRNTCAGGQDGIMVSDFSDRCVISYNDCTNCKRGISVFITSHCQVIENECSWFDERGIGAINAPYTLISGNNCSSGVGSGILLNENSGYSDVRYNNCSYNGQKGIYVGSSAAVDVAFNTVIGNRGDGVYIASSFDMTVHGNQLKDNLGVGVYINSPSSAYVNEVYWNNFIGNNYATTAYNPFYSQAYDNGNSNWNRTTEPFMGNYWADYASQGDADGDGIVDTGYRIGYNGARTDAFPLVSMWSPFVPNAPAGLTAAAGSQYVTLEWSAPGYDGGESIDHYIVYQDGLEVLRTASTEVTISGLSNGQTYAFSVAAHNRMGTGAMSSAVTATPDTSLPTAPTGLAAAFGDGGVTLTWTAPSNDGGLPITAYIIYQDGGEVARTSGTEITLSGLTNGQEVSFKVAAENSRGRSEFSGIVYVTPLRTHDPIRVDSDAHLAAMAAAEGWPGDGSESSPFIIQGYGIDANGAKAGLFIGNTTLHLVVRQCYITDAGPYNDVAQGGVVLYYATNVDIVGTNCSSNPVNGIVLYHSSGNSVTGCSAFGNYIGLRIDFSDNVQVRDNRLSGNHYAGVVLEDYSNGGVVSGNVMIGNAVGAVFRYSYDVAVTGNTITNGSSSTSAGVYIDHCSGLSVNDNDLSDNGYGIDLHSSDGVNISNNVVLRSAQAGMRIGDSYDDLYSDGNTIEGNTCSGGGAGVQLARARDTVLRNNLIEDNTAAGISIIEGSDRAVVQGNEVHGNHDGVQIANSNDVEVLSNDLSGNDRFGLRAMLSSRTVIDGNDASNCGEAGIALNNAPYTVISHNVCSGSIVGVQLVENSGSCQITGNTVTGNSMRGIHVQESGSLTIDRNLIAGNSGEGIYLHTVFDTTITGNEIEDNAGYGVCIISPSSSFINTIYGNTFKGNNGAADAYSTAHVQAYDDGGSVWNGETAGNRWLDLTVPDASGDGTVDVPYLIDGHQNDADKARDQYPQACNIVVVSPVGGTLGSNDVREIAWTSTGPVPTVTIELHRGGALVATIASGVTNTGSYLWTVPGDLPDAQGYSIVIYDPANGACRDAGEEFAITGPQTITVLTPSSGEAWNAGTAHTISWSTTGLIGSVTVGVYLNGALVADLGTLGGSMNEAGWTIPLVQPYGSYTVKVTSVLYPEVWSEGKLIIEGLPEAPGLSVEANNAAARLSWTAPTYMGSGPVTYAIYRDGTFIGTASGLTYDDTGLVNGQTYSYRVAAVNAVGEGSPSGPVEATPFRPNTAPVAALASSSSLGNDATVFYFDASGSNDNENDAMEYRWSVDEGEWSEWSSIGMTSRTFGLAGEHVITVEVRDIDGLSSQARVTVLIDNDAPIIEHQLIGTAGENGWYVTSVIVNAAANDANGIGTFEYSINRAGGVSLDGSFELSADGLYEIALRATDLAGNEAVVFLDVRIDTAAPTIDGWTVETPNAAGWFSGPVTVRFVASDLMSGAAVSGMEATLESDGLGQFVTWTVRDEAGNAAELTIGGINIDMTVPATALYVNGAPMNGPMVAGDQLELLSIDELSGVASVEYRIDDGAWTVVGGERSGVIDVPGGTHDLYFRSVDLAGNVEVEQYEVITTPTSVETELRYSGDLNGQMTDAADLAAVLTDAQGNGIAGLEVTFVIGTQSATAITGTDGVAVANVVLDQVPGTVPVTVSFAGDAEHLASWAEAVFDIAAERATVIYTGEVIDRNLFTLKAAFSEQEDGSFGRLADAAVTFSIYAPSSLTSPVKVVGPVPVAWTADGAGTAWSTVYLPEGNFIVVASISGESYEGPTSHLVVLTSYSGTGTFVAGGGYIIDPSGGTGSFGFMVRYDRFLSPMASLVYAYTEDGADKVFISKTVSQLSLRGSHLTLYGTGSVLGYDPETGSVTALATNLRFQADGYDNDRGADVFMVSLYRTAAYHDAGYRPLGIVTGDVLIKKK